MAQLGHSMQIDLNDAISYNSLIELKNVFLKGNQQNQKFGKGNASIIACALKSRKVAIIMLMPDLQDSEVEDDGRSAADNMLCSNLGKNSKGSSQLGAAKYFILKMISTQMKPTSLI